MTVANVYFVTFFVISLIGSSLANPHHIAGDHESHCHAEGKDSKILHIEVGESASLPGKCKQVTCQKDFTLSELTCPLLSLSAGCKLSDTDYTKPYPECCPKATCAKKY